MFSTFQGAPQKVGHGAFELFVDAGGHLGFLGYTLCRDTAAVYS